MVCCGSEVVPMARTALGCGMADAGGFASTLFRVRVAPLIDARGTALIP